jgi:hypothetical protein
MERRDFLISTTALPLLYIGLKQKEPDNRINTQAASGVPHGSGDLVYVRYAPFPSYSSYVQGRN